MTKAGLSKILSQAKNTTTYNLARMGMLLRRVQDTEHELLHGHTLLRFLKQLGLPLLPQ